MRLRISSITRMYAWAHVLTSMAWGAENTALIVWWVAFFDEFARLEIVEMFPEIVRWHVHEEFSHPFLACMCSRKRSSLNLWPHPMIIPLLFTCRVFFARSCIVLMNITLFILPMSIAIIHVGRSVKAHRTNLAAGDGVAVGKKEASPRESELRKSQWQLWILGAALFVMCIVWIYQSVPNIVGTLLTDFVLVLLCHRPERSWSLNFERIGRYNVSSPDFKCRRGS